jgi:hypothetical protein
MGRSGTAYGAGVEFVRLELLMREQTFGVMLPDLPEPETEPEPEPEPEP